MSAVASAYKTTEAQLSEALSLRNQKQYQRFWEVFRTYEIATLPYSGYVLAAVIPFAQSKGIDLPTACGTALSEADRAQLGVVACGKPVDYESVARGIAQLQVTDPELRQYYADLYTHDWDEAAKAMRHGFAFIQQGIEALNSGDQLLIFLIT